MIDTVYIALFTKKVECTHEGYKRAKVPMTSSYWEVREETKIEGIMKRHVVTNIRQIYFPDAKENIRVTGFGISDTPDGDMLYYGKLDFLGTLIPRDEFIFEPKTMTIKTDNIYNIWKICV